MARSHSPQFPTCGKKLKKLNLKTKQNKQSNIQKRKKKRKENSMETVVWYGESHSIPLVHRSFLLGARFNESLVLFETIDVYFKLYTGTSWTSGCCYLLSLKSCSFGPASPAPSHALEFIFEVNVGWDQHIAFVLGPKSSWLVSLPAFPSQYRQGKLSR